METQTACNTLQKPDYISTLTSEGFEARKYKIPCPFHSDKTPSFIIYPNQQGHCFGCGWHGDIISFIMQYKNLSFKEACNYLGIGGNDFKSKPPDSKTIRKTELVRAFKTWERDYSDHVCLLLRGIRKAIAEGFKDIPEAEQYAELFHLLPVLEYHYEILCSRDEKGKYELFLEVGYGWL